MPWFLLDFCVFGSYDLFPLKKLSIGSFIEKGRICIALVEPHAKLLFFGNYTCFIVYCFALG